jgi:signal transduction histidine kinase
VATSTPTRLDPPGLVPVVEVASARPPDGALGPGPRPVVERPPDLAEARAAGHRISGWALAVAASLAVAALGVTAFTLAQLWGLVIFGVGSLAGATGAAGAVAGASRLRRADREDAGAAQVVAELQRLEEAGRVLGLLHELSRSLPTNQDLDEVLAAIRAQLVARFDAHRLAILTLDDGRWRPELVEGFGLGPDPILDGLPAPLDLAAVAASVLRVDDLAAVCDRAGSGLYARLVVDGVDAGLLAVEHVATHRFDDRAVALFDGVSELVALGIDNARSFGQLRSSAAAEERARIARDLHDRLGQWLTYISLELERINGGFPHPDDQLDRLQGDVRSAIDELREALVELRTTIRPDRPLGVVLGDVVHRFAQRTGLAVELAVPDDPTRRLGAVVENELLRIVQESLTNIEKHADATAVHINWSVDGGRGILTIGDDGRGFDPTRGVRSTAYGLVGMRERAAAVGAILEIASQRGAGTVITVLVGDSEECRP